MIKQPHPSHERERSGRVVTAKPGEGKLVAITWGLSQSEAGNSEWGRGISAVYLIESGTLLP